ncbi:MAG: Trk system potassium transporter TrkA [Clostridiales Family XIII bacterium]|jgi:trk system potassium uptake protein TrkA|nr:Trk system potassium transporter TrkA [Clostridiales Family XIII bacterium]
MKIAVVGAGKLGLRIIEILMGGDYSLTVIDKDEELITKLSNSLDVMTVSGNAKEVSLLEEMNIASYDYVIVTTDRDEKNIVIASICKKLGVPKVVARIRDPEHMHQQKFLMDTFKLDYLVNPDRSVAEEINKYLVEKYSFNNGILHAGRVSLIEFGARKMKSLVGLTIAEANEKLAEKDMVLAALSKNGKLNIASNNRDLIIEEPNEIYVVGDRNKIDSLAVKLIDKDKYTDIQKVMIAGGGKSGLYLARMLETFGASVKIIEQDKKRCQYLATHLSNVLILNGDATDIDLLNNENFSEMDAFVSTTGFDEENLLLALRAKNAGIEDVIAKISRESFGALIKSMGVDVVLNPVDISASHILRFIKGTRILSSQIIQGQVEMVHLSVDPEMKIVGKPLGKLKMTEGIAIIAIQRGTAVIIPSAEDKVQEGDRIVILSQLSDSFDLEKLIRIKQGLFS